MFHTLFWAVLIFPWLLDSFTGGVLFKSLFGAGVWGLWVALTLASGQVQNPRTKNLMTLSSAGLGAFWLGAWLVCLFVGPSLAEFSDAPRGLDKLLSSKIVSWIHGGLLAAGIGITVLIWVSSALWLIGESQIRKNSWQRRQPFLKKIMPPLEVLGKILTRSLWFAFLTWGLGLLLALFIAIRKWAIPPEIGQLKPFVGSSHLYWQMSLALLGILWILLGTASVSLSRGIGKFQWDRRLFWGALSTSTLFILVFFGISSGRFLPEMHRPVEWFLR